MAEHQPSITIRTTASPYRCADCPPERVCAWGCVQGAGIEEIVIGAALALEGTGWSFELPDVAQEPTRSALAESYDAPSILFYTL